MKLYHDIFKVAESLCSLYRELQYFRSAVVHSDLYADSGARENAS